MNLETLNIPFPYFSNKIAYDGSIAKWPECCVHCKGFSCQTIKSNELSVCSFGINYQKITNDLIIAGIIVIDYGTSTIQKQKAIKKYPKNKVFHEQIINIGNHIHSFKSTLHDLLTVEKTTLIDEYISTKQYESDFLLNFQEDIQKGLSFLHDYKQINSQISQNINVILEQKYSGTNIEEKLAQSTDAEKAIYWASKFLHEKLDIARFLIHPEWINMESEKKYFKFHGVFTKYYKIFENIFKKKNITVTLNSKSFKEIYGNAGALSVIIQTFLDNAIKYSLRNSFVEIHVIDKKDNIYFSVISYGPRINPNEKEKIFHAFYRGKEAEKIQEEGAGYGLYLSQLIAKSIGTIITYEQEEKATKERRYKTIFSVNIPFNT